MIKIPFINLGLQYQLHRKKILSKFDYISKKGDFILGDELKKFENEFAQFCGTKYAVGVGSGSDALSFSMIALSIKKGDEVIIPVNTFVATAWTVVNVGAKLVFADVMDDFNIDPTNIEKVITKKTKVIIPVHLTGKIAQMDKINKIAKNYNLSVIEDAAQAIGASLNNKKSGTFGVTGCFSLHPLKNLNVHGDGGVITTNNSKLNNFFKKIRNHGLKNRNELEFWGYNSRLDNIQAGIARIKLKYLEKWNRKFINIARLYSKELKNYVKVPIHDPNRVSVYHRYIIVCHDREKLQNYLINKKGIETTINYPVPLHLQPASRHLGYKKGDFPIAEKQSKSILSLPIYPELTDNQISYVIKSIKSFYV